MRQFAKFAGIALLCVGIIAIADLFSISRKEQQLSRIVKSIGGRTGSIPVWPFGTEYRITLTSVPNQEQMRKLTVANRMRGWVGIAFEDCNLSDGGRSELLTQLPECQLYTVAENRLVPLQFPAPRTDEP